MPTQAIAPVLPQYRKNLSGSGAPAAKSPAKKISLKRITLALTIVLSGTAAAGGLFVWGQRALFLKQRAQAGEVEAQYRMGRRSYTVASSREELLSGVGWMHKAAQGGHAKAQTTLGVVYARGINVSQSPELALHWLTKAALQGEPLAQNELATLYAKGLGVPRDLKKAVHWYRQAASTGSRAAERNLCLLELAQSKSLGDIATRGGKCYPKASLRKIDPGGITVTFDAKGGVGFAKLKVQDLPEKLALLCVQDTGRSRSASGFKWAQLDMAAIQM